MDPQVAKAFHESTAVSRKYPYLSPMSTVSSTVSLPIAGGLIQSFVNSAKIASDLLTSFLV